ncbi:6-bladed beta-propeller [Gemmatimonadota bacterium]
MRVYDGWAFYLRGPFCCLGPKWGLKNESAEGKSVQFDRSQSVAYNQPSLETSISYGLNQGTPVCAYTFFSPLLCLLLLIGCSNADRGTTIPEGHLELVWAVQPADASDEPWFGSILDVEVFHNRIYVSDGSRGEIIELNQTGQFVRSIGGKGGGPGEFLDGPLNITISPNGYVFIQHSGNARLVSRFSTAGRFVQRTDWQPVRLSYFPSEYPVALNDSTLFWDIGPRVDAGISIEDYLLIPLYQAVRGNEAFQFGKRYLNEFEYSTLESLVKRSQWKESQLHRFTSGYAVQGPDSEEALFVRKGDPYTVHRYKLSGTTSKFTFSEPRRDTWIQEFRLSPEELEEGLFTHPDYLGSYPVRSTNTLIHRYSFTHQMRDLVRHDNILAISVVVISEEFDPDITEGGFEHYIYIVDLTKEKAVMRIETDPLKAWRLQGILEDGTLVFTLYEPAPGIAAYRVMPD